MNQKGMLNRGDKIVLSGFGGGLTWGSVYLTWQVDNQQDTKENKNSQLTQKNKS